MIGSYFDMLRAAENARRGSRAGVCNPIVTPDFFFPGPPQVRRVATQRIDKIE